MNWDKYFHGLCVTVASKSPCHSRKIGAILVRDKSIVSTGYNGPPRGVPHCSSDRYIKDEALQKVMNTHSEILSIPILDNSCPRQALGYGSGTHMEVCTAQHAEENAVSNAARNGVSVLGCTLYMNSVIPCKNCLGTLINAGINKLVIEEAIVYDEWTRFFLDNSNILIREFKHEDTLH